MLFMVIFAAEENDLIALELVLVKRISEDCLTMFNADGSMRKLQRASCFSCFQDSLCLKFLQHMPALLI